MGNPAQRGGLKALTAELLHVHAGISKSRISATAASTLSASSLIAGEVQPVISHRRCAGPSYQIG